MTPTATIDMGDLRIMALTDHDRLPMLTVECCRCGWQEGWGWGMNAAALPGIIERHRCQS